MFEKFSKGALEIIDESLKIARSLNKKLVGTEHLLLAMYQRKDTICHFLLKEKDIDYVDILNALNSLIILRKNENESFTYTTKFQEVILFSKTLSDDLNQKYVYDEHIFYVLLKEEDTVAKIILEKLNLNIDELMCDIEEIFNFFDEKEQVVEEEKIYPFLTNLTTKEKIHPFIKRKDYIEKIKYILNKKQKNNPLLIGAAGVGKTAIIEGLSKELKNDVIYELSLSSIVSGTKYRGELEEKITNAMEYIKNKKAILFIDEIHNIVGAGSNEGTLDVANILKPYLSRSDIKLIGSTTLDEYYQYIAKDKALSRRFQNIFISEPSIKETKKIIQGIKSNYESFHNIKYDQKSINKIINLSSQYLINKTFPDKAIDIMDEVGARYKQTKKPITTLIDEVIMDQTGIKNTDIQTIVNTKLNYDMLKPNYIKFLKRCELDLDINNIGTLYVDKNFNIKHLMSDVELIFGITDETMLELDFEMYLEHTMLNNLIGSPKGYVGYTEGGILSEHIIKYPISIIYIKNFLKASKSIQNYIISLTKTKHFTDNKDRTINLINTLFILEKENVENNVIGFINKVPKEKIVKQDSSNSTKIKKILDKYKIKITNFEKIKSELQYEKVVDLIVKSLINNKYEYTYNKKDKAFEELN